MSIIISVRTSNTRQAIGQEQKGEQKMKDMRKPGYFTGWLFDNESCKKSHRIYYNDIDITTGDLICDGVVIGNVKMVDRYMSQIDKRNNYMW